MAEDILDLQGRRAARECQQPAAGRVTGQVDENVDPVGTDLVGDLEVGQADGRAPMVGPRPETCGDRVFHRHFGIAEQLCLNRIVGGQQRFGEQRHCVLAKIGGDVADAQAAAGQCIRRPAGVGRREGARMLLVPGPELGKDCLGRQVFAIVQ